MRHDKRSEPLVARTHTFTHKTIIATTNKDTRLSTAAGRWCEKHKKGCKKKTVPQKERKDKKAETNLHLAETKFLITPPFAQLPLRSTLPLRVHQAHL